MENFQNQVRKLAQWDSVCLARKAAAVQGKLTMPNILIRRLI